MNLSDLVGEHILSGIEIGTMEMEIYGCTAICNFIKFAIDGVTLLAMEDPDDGYRSYMRDLVIVEEPCKIKLPDIRVCCTMCPDGELYKNEVLSFVDVLSGKEILAVGTENTDDYYPYCVLEWTPENMFCNMKEAATDKNDGGKWIPVTERLPEYDLPKDSKKKVIKVLVAIISKRGVYTIRTQTRQKGYYYNYPDEWDWGKYSSGLITHWMPLPEPPKGD